MKKYLTKLIAEAVKDLGAEAKEISFDVPKDEKFGDLSVNTAMLLAKELKQPPRKIAEQIVERI